MLVAPKAHAVPASIGPDFDLLALLGPTGKLAIGDPRFVIGGVFARQALEKLGLWARVQGHLHNFANVREALGAVESGADPAGIVFASDAQVSPGLGVIGAFPASSHNAIRYNFSVLTAGNQAAARAFISFLDTQPARDIFTQYGFTPP